MNKRTLSFLWFISNIIMIAYFSYLHYTIDKDAAVGYVYFILLFTFPIGFLVPLIFYGLFLCFPNFYMEANRLFIADIIVPGIVFTLFGYFQWFYIVPKINQYLKTR